MYSRYKIQTPAPPPDYAGTAFKRDSASPSGGTPVTENPTAAEQSANPQESPVESVRERTPEARWEVPPDILPDDLPDDLPDEQLIPDAPLTPEASVGEESPSGPESKPNPEPDPAPPEDNDAPAEEESSGSLLAGMNPDDLLFIGAMLYLLSGKTGDDSFLLLAYLLTCGL